MSPCAGRSAALSATTTKAAVNERTMMLCPPQGSKAGLFSAAHCTPRRSGGTANRNPSRRVGGQNPSPPPPPLKGAGEQAGHRLFFSPSPLRGGGGGEGVGGRGFV